MSATQSSAQVLTPQRSRTSSRHDSSSTLRAISSQQEHLHDLLARLRADLVATNVTHLDRQVDAIAEWHDTIVGQLAYVLFLVEFSSFVLYFWSCKTEIALA